MSLYLVMGASRGIGLETVKAALASGHQVKAFSRSVRTIAIEDARLTKIAGDALDQKDVARAVEGVDAVIQTLGVPLSPETILKGTTFFSQATRALTTLMCAHGPKRLVVLTGMGAGDSRGVGSPLYTALFFPLVLKRIYDDKDVQEQIVKASGLDWTIARPGGLTNGPATGRYHVLERPASLPSNLISRADVADYLLRAAGDPSTIGKAPVLVGP